MILYLLITALITLGLCVVVYRYLSRRILAMQISLDDGRGYYLIAVLLIAFFGSSLGYYIGCILGFDQHPEQQTSLVAAILLNALMALLALTYGLVKFREGERY